MSSSYGNIYKNILKPLIDDRKSGIYEVKKEELIVACNWLDVIVNEFDTYGVCANINENNEIIISVTFEDMVVDNNKHIFYRLLPLVKRLEIEHLSEEAFNMKFVFEGI